MRGTETATRHIDNRIGGEGGLEKHEIKVDSKKNQPIIFTEADRELLLNLDKRLRKLEFAFTPQGLAKGIESVFRQKTEQVPEMQESP